MKKHVPTPFEKYRAAYPSSLEEFLTRNTDATALDFVEREIKLNDSIIGRYENPALFSEGDAPMPTEAEYYTALRKDEFLWNRKKELLPDVSSLMEEAAEIMAERNSASAEVKDAGTVKPIKWHGTLGQLIYLFEQLQQRNFFSLNTDLQADIRKHFCDANGKPYVNTKQVKQGYMNTKTGKPKRAKEIEDIAAQVKQAD